MKVLLIDIDNKYRSPLARGKRFPNLALMKISSYYKNLGSEVGFNIENPDFVYISCVFNRYHHQAFAEISKWTIRGVPFMFGGPALSLDRKLINNMEWCKPDYDLYPFQEYSMGFSTRGCIRKCEYCIVPQKEGGIQIWQHPREFHDFRFKTCMLMDNNLFAAPQEWQDEIFHWFAENKVRMINNGFDARLLNQHRVDLLNSVKHASTIRFAWDNMSDEERVRSAIKLLQDNGINTKRNVDFYVLAGFNTSFQQDLYRCNELRKMKTGAYVMPYKVTPEITDLAKWANRKCWFWGGTFDEYLKDKENKKEKLCQR